MSRRARFYWYDDTGPGWIADVRPHTDDLHTTWWKARPVPPGDVPYRVTPDGVVDLHPSQWSVR